MKISSCECTAAELATAKKVFDVFPMRISRVAYKDFPPFKDGHIEFPSLPDRQKGAEIHFFVGPNGSGKTRLLSLLSASLGNTKELESRGPNKLSAHVFAKKMTTSRYIHFRATEFLSLEILEILWRKLSQIQISHRIGDTHAMAFF